MAIVDSQDRSQVRGKMNKKSKEIHRVRNGREYVHTVKNEYAGPPSKAQKLQQSIFGKTNAIVNRIMSDPAQVQEWTEKMVEYNKTALDYTKPLQRRYTTVRSFVYAMISEQLKQTPAAKRRKAHLPVTLPKGVRFQIKSFSDLSTTELYEILKARFTVFVGEQHIHYIDEDNIDYLATHFTIRQKGLVLAYARTYPDAEEGVLCVGRMLTIHRGKGFGKYIMDQIVAFARAQKMTTIRLHAQTHAVPFYQNLGFHTVGDIFIEAEIPHMMMEMTLE